MGEVVADGLWCDVRRTERFRDRPALFLDRDGTLIDLVPYLADPAGVRLVDEVVALVRLANAADWAVVVITNQSGVGRGLYGWADVAAVQKRMHDLLAAAGARVDASYAAGHAPASDGGPAESPWRKPAPGLLFRADEDLGVDLKSSMIAGDGAHDLAAGKAAGLPQGWLVSTGYGADKAEQEKALVLADSTFAVETGGISRARWLFRK